VNTARIVEPFFQMSKDVPGFAGSKGDEGAAYSALKPDKMNQYSIIIFYKFFPEG
jgi:hypothetical protein